MIDENKDGKISVKELSTNITKLTRFNRKEIKLIFSFFDIDGNGQIDETELKTQLTKANVQYKRYIEK